MHRSGTSALTRLLNLLGVELAQVLEPGNKYNAPGYWESQQLMQVHDEMLNMAGSFWDDWTRLNPSWNECTASERFRGRILDVLETDFGQSSLFAIKDPRICRFVPFWIDVLKTFEAKPICILPVRSPLEVAASLQRRDGFIPAKSYLLWLRHVLDAEASTRNIPRLITNYDDLLTDWRSVVEKISSELTLSFPRQSATAEAEISQFLQGSYRHHRADPNHLNTDPVISTWVKTTFQAIQELSRDKNSQQALERLDGVREELNGTSHIYGPVIRFEELQRRERESDIEYLNKQLREEREGVAEERQRLQQEKTFEINRITKEMGAEVARLDNLFSAENTRLLQKLESRQMLFVKERTDRVRVKDQMDSLALRLNTLQTSNAWMIAKPFHWLERRQPESFSAAMKLPKLLWWTLSGQLGDRKRLRETAKRVLDSGLFDENMYITNNPDILDNAIQPLLHWLILGWREGRNPHSLFDTKWYLRHAPELMEQDINPLVHFLDNGTNQKRDPSPLFDTHWYMDQHPEVFSSGMNPLTHYLLRGAAAAWSPHPLFDHDWYARQSPDAVSSGANLLVHYIQYGASAGRTPCPLFDSSWYLDQYPEVAKADINPLVDYLTQSKRIIREPGPEFDTSWYLEQYPDAAASSLPPLTYHLLFGVALEHKPNARATNSLGSRQASQTSGTATSQVLAGIMEDWKNNGILTTTSTEVDSILIVDWKAPTPDRDSGSFRMKSILGCLVNSGLRVIFVGDQEAEAPHYSHDLTKMGITVITGRDEALRYLAYHGGRFKAAFLARPEVAERYLAIVRAFATNATVFYDTVDLHWVRFERGAEVLKESPELADKARYYKRLEIAIAKSADVTIAISDEEKSQLLAEAPSLSVRVLPNIHEPTDYVPEFESRRDLFFIGGFAHLPNLDAAHYLVSEIMPRIWEKLEDISLHIVGSNMPDEIRDLATKRVHTVGYIPDVKPYFEKSRIFVAPLRHGAGMKGKVGQSLSYGLPVVTSSVGAEGIGLIDGKNALISDDPDRFSEHVIRLYSDRELWNTLSNEGLSIIKSKFSPSSAQSKLLSWIGQPENTEGK